MSDLCSMRLHCVSKTLKPLKKQNFFTLGPVTRKRKDILEGAIKGEKPGIDRGTYASGRKLAAGQF